MMPSGNITFPARVKIMGRTVDLRAKFVRSVKELGPTPTLTFTHHDTDQDLWTAGAFGDDPVIIRKILESVQDSVESRGYKAGKLVI